MLIYLLDTTNRYMSFYQIININQYLQEKSNNSHNFSSIMFIYFYSNLFNSRTDINVLANEIG